MEEVVRHQFTAQGFLLSDANSWDAVKDGHVLVFQLLCDPKSAEYRLVAWDTQDDEQVALNVNLCRKSEFKIDHERFSYVSVPGETEVGQLLGMSFRSEQDNRTAMGAIAQAIEHMRAEKKRRMEAEANNGSGKPAALDYSDPDTGSGHLNGKQYRDEDAEEDDCDAPRNDNFEDASEENDTATKSSVVRSPMRKLSMVADRLHLTQLLKHMSCERSSDILRLKGCENIEQLFRMTADDFTAIEELDRVERRILISTVNSLGPYVVELQKAGHGVGEAIVSDDSIVKTIRDISEKIRASSAAAPSRPPRPASRPDMFSSRKSSPTSQSLRRPSSKVAEAAMRSAEARARRSSEVASSIVRPSVLRVASIATNVDGGRPRTGSHSPYIHRASESIHTPAHGDGVDEDGISRVYNLKRKVHVKYNVSKARFDHVPEGLELQFNRQFGVPLKQCPAVKISGYDEKIPAVLVMMRNELMRTGALETEGIFRLAPERAACALAKKQINHGTFDGCSDVNIMANLIKVWFRDLPQKLLNAAPGSAIEHVARVGEQGADELIKRTVEPERSLMLWLLDMMADIVKAKRKTRMDARNMAIVLSPNLYQPTEEEPMAAMSRMSKVVQAVTALLKWRIQTHRKSISADDA